MADKKTKTRSKTPKTRVWKTVFVTLGLLLWVGASIIVSQVIVGNIMYAILGEALGEPVWEAIYSAISYVIALTLIIFVPPHVSVGAKITNDETGKVKTIGGTGEPSTRKELGLKGWPTWTDIGLAPIGLAVYFVIAALLVALFTLFPWFDAGEAQDVGFNLIMTGWDKILAFVTLVVIAPIAEEIIFRGWLYGKLRKRFSTEMSNVTGMILAILLVSLLFGLVHMQWNVGVNVFALSVVACVLREVTGTIYAGILLHMLKNGLAFWMLYVLGVS